MDQDPIITEIRKIRHQIEADCKNNPDKYFERLQKIQQDRKKLVRRKPKPRLVVKNKPLSAA